MAFKPLRDFLLVSKEDGPKQTVGGLYIPTTVENNIVTGTVLAVGTGRLTADGSVVLLEVTVGDKVVFNKNYAVELKDGDNTYLLLKEDQVFCVVR